MPRIGQVGAVRR